MTGSAAAQSHEADFGHVAALVEGVPYMSRSQGQRIFDHLRSTGARDVLEIGTAYGVSAAYMAAAISPSGGHVTTIDHQDLVHSDPSPEETLERAGQGHAVTLVRVPDSSYTWWLKDRVSEQSDEHGNCVGVYDFCYLDGAHNWTTDGLAVILIEKLLRPGGWLLLDDLHWTYALGDGGSEEAGLSDAERRTPHMSEVFDLLVRQHPGFDDFVVQDGKWGWAHKGNSTTRRYRAEVTSSLQAQLTTGALRLARRTAADLRLRWTNRSATGRR